jgi:diacylglycerol O-acyltransferase / wax synthase
MAIRNRVHSRPQPLELESRMTPTDALFWYAEGALPTLRPLIAGLYLLDRAPHPRKMEQTLRAGLFLVPRLRQRVIEAPLHLGLPEWVEDPHFDFDYHFRHVRLPEPGDERTLLDMTAALFATPLDRERPLWEAYWIDGVDRGRSAFFFKMHHSMVDGVGSIALLNALTQRHRQDEPQFGAARRRRQILAGGTSRVARLLADNGSEAMRLLGRAAALPARAVADPIGMADQAQKIARGLRGMMSNLGQPLITDPLASSSAGISRRLDVTDVPIERLQRIKAPLRVTLNDVVLAALVGTLGAYHRERRVHVDALNCMVPMNLRGRDEHDKLGNRVGMFGIVLPIGERRIERRLSLIHDQTQAAKADQRGAAMPFLIQALPLVPGFAFRWLARNSLGRVNVVCTNVPGVRERRHMAGARVDAIYPFAGVVEGTPLVMALLSYAGMMNIGFDTDPEAIPDPHRISELFEEELQALERLAHRVSPRLPAADEATKARRGAARRTAPRRAAAD